MIAIVPSPVEGFPPARPAGGPRRRRRLLVNPAQYRGETCVLPGAVCGFSCGSRRQNAGYGTNRLILHHAVFLWIRRRGPFGTRVTAVLVSLKGLPEQTRLIASVPEQQKQQVAAREPPAFCCFVPPFANSRAFCVGL